MNFDYLKVPLNLIISEPGSYNSQSINEDVQYDDGFYNHSSNEESIVSFSNAEIEPYTVMIKLVDATSALVTVLR